MVESCQMFSHKVPYISLTGWSETYPWVFIGDTLTYSKSVNESALLSLKVPFFIEEPNFFEMFNLLKRIIKRKTCLEELRY